MKRLSRMRILLITGIILITIFTTAFITVGRANTVNANISGIKCFKTIEIEYGDTVWDIAKANLTPEYSNTQEYVDEIIKFNRMDSDAIYEGEFIILPYYQH
ncbi:MAG: yneA [Clostridiales bacterium]|nr:yneA [Clostridiales bacterium]